MKISIALFLSIFFIGANSHAQSDQRANCEELVALVVVNNIANEEFSSSTTKTEPNFDHETYFHSSKAYARAGCGSEDQFDEKVKSDTAKALRKNAATVRQQLLDDRDATGDTARIRTRDDK